MHSLSGVDTGMGIGMKRSQLHFWEGEGDLGTMASARYDYSRPRDFMIMTTGTAFLTFTYTIILGSYLLFTLHQLTL